MDEFEKNFMNRFDGVEEEEEVEDGSENTGNQLEEDQNGLFSKCIPSPVISGAEHPMVLLLSDSVYYVGGLIAIDDSGAFVSYPLAYMEMLVPSGIPEMGDKLQVGFKKPVIALNLPKKMWFAITSLIVLGDSESDRRLISAYAENVNNILTSEIGIYAPTADDLVALKRG